MVKEKIHWAAEFLAIAEEENEALLAASLLLCTIFP